MTIHGTPLRPTLIRSCTVTITGCSTWASAVASRFTRSRLVAASSSANGPGISSLTATVRSRWISKASQTVPIVPPPSCRSSR